MSYRIEIETDDCMSSGKCVADHPETFAFDDDELATLRPDGVELSDEAKLRTARQCPSQAIIVRDADGSRVST